MSELNNGAQRIVYVAGSQGVTGRGVIESYAKLPNTLVFGLSRRNAPDVDNIRHISVDLTESADIHQKLSVLPPATHLVFAAYVDKPTATEKSDANYKIFANLLDHIRDSQPLLRHVTTYQGGKAYGSDLGKYKTPAKEDDPRLMPPNYYQAQEELLRSRKTDSDWDFTILRPGGAICGPSTGTAMNLTMVIAVYATISKELGLPLRFPGSEAAYRVLYQVTSAKLLGNATVWAGDSDSARNELFNVTNGDLLRWQHLWPKIARMFDMEIADPIPFSLSSFMADKGPLWDSIVKKYGLRNIPYNQIVDWGFGDYTFRYDFDNVSSTIKIRQAGFGGCIDTEEMFASFFQEFRQDKLIP